MLLRIKQSALILAGSRPAEVRFDEDDLRFAQEVARFWAATFAEWHPELAGAQPRMIDDVRGMFLMSLVDNASWHRKGTTRDRRQSLERQMEVPF